MLCVRVETGPMILEKKMKMLEVYLDKDKNDQTQPTSKNLFEP